MCQENIEEKASQRGEKECWWVLDNINKRQRGEGD